MEFVEDGNKAADDEDDDDGCSDELAAANVFLFLDELSLNPKEEELLASFILLLLGLAFRLENSVVVVVEAVVGLGIVGQQEYKFLLEFEWSTKSIQLLLPLVVVVAVVGGGLLTKVCSLLEFD